MTLNSTNSSLHTAKRKKKDDLYTQLSDIEKELAHYKDYFKGKVVYCNCDDPSGSNFAKYFRNNFHALQLKELLTCYLKYDGTGDFRSYESIDLLKQADVVVTNPPFSLFREYVGQLIKFEKDFIIMGSLNAITYKTIFPLIKNNKLWLGVNLRKGSTGFVDGDNGGHITKVANVRWFTNVDHKICQDDIVLHEKYDSEKYPKYDNYDAININRTKDIPIDYEGIMGVPITFLDKYNPEQFEIIAQMATTKVSEYNYGYPYVSGKKVYARLLIKKR